MNTLTGTLVLFVAIFAVGVVATQQLPEPRACSMDCEGKQDCEIREYPNQDGTEIDRACAVWTEDGARVDWCCARVSL